MPPRSQVEATRTSSFALLYGSGRSSTASITLNIAVFAPIPSANARKAMPGQCKDGYAREGRIFSEHPHSVSDILHEAFERSLPPNVADILFQRFHAAHLHLSFADSFLTTHARSHLLFHCALNVGLQLFVKFALHLLFSK